MRQTRSHHLAFHDYQQSDWLERPHVTLWGHPIEHSLSPLIHNTAAEYLGLDWRYVAVDVTAQHMSSLLAIMNREVWRGGNITIPHKQTFLAVVDELSPAAREIGAINTLIKDDHGHQLTGDNTDWIGFLHPLDPYIDELAEERAIVFGTGGAARGVAYALVEAGIRSIILVSRSPERNRSQWDWDRGELVVCSYDNWTAYAEEALLFVNTTPLGMEPYVDESPVREADIDVLEGKLCYDLVYNPMHTRFLKQAEQVEAEIINGLPMLIGQAAKSFEAWTGQSFPEAEVTRTLQQKLRS